jgi:phosphoribosylaminoimidazole (AIR) synthetase
MQQVVDTMAQAMGGRTQAEAAAAGRCTMCGGEVTEFRDALSRQEYRISGMCQKCQDEVFGT